MSQRRMQIQEAACGAGGSASVEQDRGVAILVSAMASFVMLPA
jgi:hypothetical protein